MPLEIAELAVELPEFARGVVSEPGDWMLHPFRRIIPDRPGLEQNDVAPGYAEAVPQLMPDMLRDSVAVLGELTLDTLAIQFSNSHQERSMTLIPVLKQWLAHHPPRALPPGRALFPEVP